MKQHLVSVFAEPPLLGSIAAVVTHQDAITEHEKQRLAAARDLPATCFARAQGTKDDPRWLIDCYSPSGPIRCCGHGLLATAYVLHNQSPSTFEQRADQVIFLPNEEHALGVRKDQEGFWLSLPRLACRSGEVPNWAAEAFSEPPIRAALAGGDTDYWLLEFAPDVDLDRLRVDASRICKSTSRAVIATREGYCKNYHFLLRYFAPQYGVQEDAVTGSAHRVAADYWARRIGQKHFCARQCSMEGGVVRSRLRDDGSWVEIGGRVAIT